MFKIKSIGFESRNGETDEFDIACMQVLKLAKKAAKRKQIKRGVKEVVKAIRKNNKG